MRGEMLRGGNLLFDESFDGSALITRAFALDDAFGDGPGVLLIAGTGSAAFGRSPAGSTGRCGGWGSS